MSVAETNIWEGRRPSPSRRVCVTGASGFIGQRLVSRLVQENYSVVGLSRSDWSEADPRVEKYLGDINDTRVLDQALRDVNGVIHLAACTSAYSHDPELTFRTNVEGTRKLIQACRRFGVTRVIYIGTLSSLRKEMGPYGATKREAEELLAASGMDVTVVRPHLVYGKGGKGLFSALLRVIKKSPVIPILGHGRNPMQPVFLDDVVDCIVQCLERPEAAGRAYNLVGDESVSMNEFVDLIADAMRVRRVKLHVPFSIAYIGARLLPLVTKRPPVTYDNLIGMDQYQLWDSQAAKKDLSFIPRPLREGIKLALSQ